MREHPGGQPVGAASVFDKGAPMPPDKVTMAIVSKGEGGVLHVNVAGFKRAYRDINEVARYLNLNFEYLETRLAERPPLILFKREGRWV
jgi:hypothetical protein